MQVDNAIPSHGMPLVQSNYLVGTNCTTRIQWPVAEEKVSNTAYAHIVFSLETQKYMENNNGQHIMKLTTANHFKRVTSHNILV